MRAIALGLVLIAAKALGVSEQALPWGSWMAVALFWHDIGVASCFLLVDRLAQRSALLWIPYATVVIWAAINVVATQALASPLTMPMLGAAGGALSDSIWHYLSLANVLRLTVVVSLGVAGAVVVVRLGRRPARQTRRLPLGIRVVFASTVVLFLALGPVAQRRVDIRGLQRNSVTALVGTLTPRVSARAASAVDWRRSPVLPEAAPGIVVPSTLHGAGAGRNVLVIVLESTAARYLRGYGAPDDPTPRLTKFTEHAVQFDRAYAVYPESIKGLFSTLCSRAPAFDVRAEAHASAACASVVQRLRASGYHAGLFHSGRFGYLGMQAIVRQQAFDVARDAADIGGVRESSFGVDETSTIEHMLSWIDGLPPTRPFFAMYLPIAGHHPYATTSPGPFAGAGDLVAYKNALHEGDAALGVLFDAFRARGLDRNTVFLIYGDHGEAFGQHGGNYAHSLFLYDENVHVPLWLVLPGLTTERRRMERVASLLDVAPTILDVVGIDADPSWEGRSLLRPGAKIAPFYTDYSSPWLGLQDGCSKYLFDMDRATDRLYDTCRDPQETVDLSREHLGEVRVYRAHLRRWAESVRLSILARSGP
jgi:hypothetical protein